jgi:hypothetical protein
VSRRVVACLAALLVGLGAMASQARADGDPASDVLAGQTVFIPQDGAVPLAQQSQLEQLVGSANRTGLPLRVALIATRSDLGSVTALWRRPSAYARFLAQELSQVFHGTLLVAMPDGFGVAHVGPGPPAAFSGAPGAGSRAGLGGATIKAVQRLAGAGGHRLVVPRRAVSGRATARSTTGLVAWLVFIVGAILIVVAWTISLRLRPPRRPDGVASSHGS